MKVYVVMESWAVPDDGDWDIDIEAVHASREGAEGNLTPGRDGGGGARERYILEMEVLP
jgi:hypothetical protein